MQYSEKMERATLDTARSQGLRRFLRRQSACGDGISAQVIEKREVAKLR